MTSAVLTPPRPLRPLNPKEALVTDAGIRAWYESCRCCSDAHPQIVEVLDRERAATAQGLADAGICETAESHGT